MFWRFGGYANISTIDTILDKPDFTLEELLDESDLIQELKQQNAKLIEYLREDKVLEQLLEYVVAPKLESVETPDGPPDDESKGRSRLLPFSRPRASSRTTDAADNDDEEQEKKRNRYAIVACEVLCSETWSFYEALTDNGDLIRGFWAFLSRPAPLDPLQASYFTKVNESLFEKKTEDMILLLRSMPNVVSNLVNHVECPMVMDLLLKIIALDRTEAGQGIVEWLYSQDMIPTLLSCLDSQHSWVVQTAAGDFIKAIITISANASQNEQQCIGPNELTRQLVSTPCVQQLIGYMLGGGNPLTVGVGIIIEVIRKNNSDYDPDVGSEANTIPSSRDPIYLGTLLRLFADNVPNFMSLIMDGPSQKQGVASTFGDKLEPLGFDRFKTCELMAELLHCSNMGLLNEPGSERLIAARDAERRRLRVEGRLGPQREEDQSADDLTMRIPHASPDEGRRLGITNADEDGFEEVEPSREMSEDTSHEFVKAEDDMATPPPVSFLDKDDDDFVDEPLSSPRLSSGADKMKEQQQFDDPDLVVAPLSPSKLTPAEPDRIEAPASEDGATKAQSPEPTSFSDINEPSQPREAPKVVAAAIPEPEATVEKGGLSPHETAASTKHRDLSPHPEDTPAPLFSSPNKSLSEAEQLSPGSTTDPASDPQNSHATMKETGTGQGEEIPVVSAAEQRSDEAGPMAPVVGDYLKMQFVDHHVVPAILSFFFAYPWNNFLHNVVYDVVQQVFNGPMDRGYNSTLAVSLFEAADITTAIINGQRASDTSQAKTKTRMGYMGHLTLIAEEVVKFTERHPPELLSEMVLDKVMSQDWINYVEGALAETRERDNAILGGVRPEVALGNRGGIGGNGMGGVGLSGLGGASGAASNALAEAGLNGGIELNEGGGNGIGPFAISAGTLMSGFGSSSDEEDEEGEGDEDDINSEFRAYTDPLNNSGNPMAPPSIPPPPPPPPPPPLSIAPSRARLQLAARLAMHQKNSEPAHGSSTLLHHDDDDDDDDDDDNADPFKDGEDDVEHDMTGEASHDGGRGSWWRGVVRGRGKHEDDSDDGDDEEFGDFAMAEDDKGGDDENCPNVLLRPLAVHPAKESSRGLSGLWPFGSRSDKDKSRHEGDKEEAKHDGVVSAMSEKRQEDKRAVEVKEATARTSIEEPDEEEVMVGAEGVAEGAPG